MPPKVTIKASLDGLFIAAALDQVGLFVIQKDHIKAHSTDLAFRSLDFTYQNNFIVALTENGKLIMFTRTAEIIHIIYEWTLKAKQPFWTSITSHNEQNQIAIRYGLK